MVGCDVTFCAFVGNVDEVFYRDHRAERRRNRPHLRLRHRRLTLQMQQLELRNVRLRDLGGVLRTCRPAIRRRRPSDRLPRTRATVTVESRMEEASGAQVLAGKYRLVHLLGKGGMGSVWLAHHLTLQSPVAIKLIDPQIASNPEALARFMREARAAAALRSPHVVQILDHGIDGTRRTSRWSCSRASRSRAPARGRAAVARACGAHPDAHRRAPSRARTRSASSTAI